MIITKMKGEMGSPCRIPLVDWILPLDFSLIMIEYWTLEIHDFIQFLHLWEKPFLSNMRSMKVQLILLKAFLMSNLLTKPLVFLIFQKFPTSFVINMAYVICLSLTKAIWFSEIMVSGKVDLSLSARTFAISLYKLVVRLLDL